MKERLVSLLTGVSFLLLLPYIMTAAINGGDTALLNRSLDVEDCLPAVVAQQIPSDYETETIKAQAVIARTNVCRRLSEEMPMWRFLTEIGESCGSLELFWDYPEAVYEQAVKETQGQVLTCEGELRLVPYHELSNGKTRSGEEVFHSDAYAYLRAVDSSADKDSPEYLSSSYIAASQMPKTLSVESRDSGGYVTALRADASLLEGEAFRQGMGLVSPDFTIQEISGRYRFLCRGRGHGLGFSQYGGNAMAKAGSTYQEILKIYFPVLELRST